MTRLPPSPASTGDSTSVTSLPIPPTHALLVVGTEAWNPADRSLGRDRIRSLQSLSSGGHHELRRFDDFGPHGVRDLLVLDQRRVLLSNGYDVVEHDLVDGTHRRWDLDAVSDLHELTLTDQGVLIANTHHDELIEVDHHGQVRRRHRLDRYRHHRARPIGHTNRLGVGRSGSPDARHDDHFHLNQGFVDLDGRTCALVHHCTGYRPTQHVRRRLVGHGSGGVIVLAADGDGDGKVIDLGLRAPHSVRRLDDRRTMVLDSGRSEIVVYDRTWRELTRVATPGWGRGAVVDPDAGVVFVAISATRARYVDDAGGAGANQVVAYDTRSWQELGRAPIGAVEQLWSLSLVPLPMEQALRGDGHA